MIAAGGEEHSKSIHQKADLIFCRHPLWQEAAGSPQRLSWPADIWSAATRASQIPVKYLCSLYGEFGCCFSHGGESEKAKEQNPKIGQVPPTCVFGRGRGRVAFSMQRSSYLEQKTSRPTALLFRLGYSNQKSFISFGVTNGQINRLDKDWGLSVLFSVRDCGS